MGEYVKINPRLLTWARDRAGYSVQELADRMKLGADRITAWESGTAMPAMTRFNELVNLLKRPSAFFFMPEPPDEPEDVAPDFRDKPATRIPPALRLQLRSARERRDTAIDLHLEMRTTPAHFLFECKTTDGPGDVAARLREYLGISAKMQCEWASDANSYASLNGWRNACEQSAGVFTFQSSKKKLDGARGFSLYFDKLPVVVLSSEDPPPARIFTLLHELTHLGLRMGGICDLHDGGIERFCNQVAAAALMPEGELRTQASKVGHRRVDDWTDEMLRRVARAFSASEQALVLRLVEIGAASKAFYNAKHASYAARVAKVKDGGFVPPHTLAIAQNGREFTRLVLDALHRDVITDHRAATYLRVTQETLPKVEQDMARFEYEPRARKAGS